MHEDKEFSLLKIEGLSVEYRYATTGKGFIVTLTYLDDPICKEKALDEQTTCIPFSIRRDTGSHQNDIAGKVEVTAEPEGDLDFLALSLTQPLAVQVELSPARTVLLVPPESPPGESEPHEDDEFAELPGTGDDVEEIAEVGEKSAPPKSKA